MGLIHEFFLVPRTVNYQELVTRSVKQEMIIDSVDVPDDFIQYIADTLKKVPSKNPALAKNSDQQGINYHGVTLFDQQSAKILKPILVVWQSTLQVSPEDIKVIRKLSVSPSPKKSEDTMQIALPRKEVLELLEKLIAMMERLEKGNLSLYHLGI